MEKKRRINGMTLKERVTALVAPERGARMYLDRVMGRTRDGGKRQISACRAMAG